MSNTQSTKHKSVVVHRQLQEILHRPGFSTVSTSSSAELDLDPILHFDLFHMSERAFNPHPHAGFSAMTYILPESKGVFKNRDSLGDRSPIGPGAVHWTQAGSGVVHEELPQTLGEDCWGLQIFVDLPAADKQLPPQAFHADAEQIPEIAGEGSLVRVLVGSFFDVRSPLTGLATVIDMFDITLEAGTSLELPLAAGHGAWVLAITGSGSVDEQPIDGNEIVLLSEAGADVTLRGDADTLRALVCVGMRLRQPVLWGGPFVMTNQADLDAARVRYEAGDMGSLE